MGHQYIERLPRTRTWKNIILMIQNGADAKAVAEAVVKAARRVILPLAEDRGVVEATWFLIRLPIVAREEDLPAALRRLGLKVEDSPGLFDIVAAVSDAVDGGVPISHRTDLGEMAQTALSETLIHEFGNRVANLYGEDVAEVHRAFSATATVKQFGRMAVAYMSRFVGKVLNYFVSRTLADHVGESRRFRTLEDQAAFTDAVNVYAGEVAAGIDDYAGRWFAKWKERTEGRISREEAGAFLSHAADKLNWALSLR